MAILVAVSESEAMDRVVSIGYELAERYDETAVLLHVVPQTDYEAHKEAIESADRYSNVSISQEQDSAARFAYRVAQESLGEFDDDRLTTRGRVGDPAEEIVAEVTHTDPRYLVLGGRRRSAVGKALFGSITQEVLLEAECPVVTVMTE